MPSKLFLPLILILCFVLVVIVILESRPSANRKPGENKAHITVEVLDLKYQDFPVSLKSYGLVKALTQTSLVARVAGVVEYIDEDLREGGVFEKGQLLVSLEKDDYLIELDIAKAQVAEAQSRYQNEKALAIEADHDWKRSGRTGEPPALAVRDPQLKAAEAALKSAEAAVKRAQLNLKRTDIRAPFDGRVLNHNVSLAQVVSINFSLADVYATDAAEIKLPVKSQDYQYLGLPLEKSRNTPKVRFTSQLAGEETWFGEVVRVSGAIDETSRQLYVVANIKDPFTFGDGNTRPLKVGEYLSAEIQGTQLKDALIIPNFAIYQGSYVYIYRKGKVHRRDVTIGWSDDRHALIESGLISGDKLVTTPLGRVTSGTLVKIAGTDRTERDEQPNKQLKSGKRERMEGGKP